jgi:thioredoxin-related protein
MLRKILIAFVATVCATAAAYAGRVDNRLGYDPQADPFDQYHAAIEQAKTEHKRVLIIAGGDWCRWCYALDRFIARNDDVNHALHDAFVVMKVYVGDENFNEFFFSQLPEARGAPHFWIVAPDRNVLASQSTGSFEQGRSGYDKTAFMGFVEKWRR